MDPVHDEAAEIPLIDPRKRASLMRTDVHRVVEGPELVQVPVTLETDEFEVAAE